MFLLETDTVNHANHLEIKKDKINITKKTKEIFSKNLKNYNSLKELNPKISYLNAKIGEVFIMNPLLYHCSDP